MAGPGGSEVGRISIRVVPNTDRFRSELRAQLEAIEKGLKVEIPVELDAGKAKAELAELARNRKTKISVDVDRSALDRVDGFFSNLGSGAGGGGSGIRALGPFADNLALVAGIAAIAAPALALVTGALAALPAVVAGIATPIGVIALGLDGIKKAAEQLKKPLDNLKKSVSGVFESRLTPVFGQLSDFLPKLDGPLQSVANGISDVAKSFVDTITSGPGLAKVQGTISNIADAVATSAPGVGRLTDGLLGLADKVSSKFPAVSTWFNKAADSFANWVDKASADGSLDTAMGNLGTTLTSVLDLVGDLAKQGFDFLSDPKFGEKMKTFVDNVRSLTNDILPALKTFFEDLSGALDDVVGAIDKIKSATNGLPDWVKKENPGDSAKNKDGSAKDTNNFFEPFTSEDAPWRTMLSEFSSSFASSMLVVQGIAQVAWATIKQQAVAAFAGLGTLIGGSIATAFTNIQGTAAAAWNGLVSVASTVVANVVSQFAQIPSRLSGVWGQLAGAAAGGFAGVVAAAASAMGNVVSTVASAVGQVISQIASIPGKAAGALAGLAGIGKTAGAALVQGLVSGILGGIGSVVSAAAKLAAAVASHMPHSPAETGPLSGKGWTLYSGQAIGQGLADGMLDQIGTVTSAAQQLTQAIKDQLDSGMVIDPKLQDQIKPTLDSLELQRKQLKVNKDALPKEDKTGRQSVTDQMAQLQTLKDQLALQKDQLGFSDKYGDSVDANSSSQNMMADSLNKVVDIGKGFAMANANQFMSDIGMSGKGAIPTIAGLGLDWASGMLSKAVTGGLGGSGTTINVGSVDDALAAKTTIDNRKALQYKNR